MKETEKEIKATIVLFEMQPSADKGDDMIELMNMKAYLGIE